MQELLGRITSLDPEASESLKVIGYFDALVEAHANAEMLLRGASLLSGCAAGYSVDRTVVRLDATGARDTTPVAPERVRWSSHPIAADWWAWLERDGDPHANDAMVLERLALGLAIALERSHPVAIARRSLEILLDPDSTSNERDAAAARLKIVKGRPVRVVAVDVAAPIEPSLRSVVLPTAVGQLRAVLDTDGMVAPATIRRGLGVRVDAGSLRRSWDSAVLALRMSGPRDPIVDAESLGSVLLLASAAAATRETQPDVTALDLIAAHDERAIDQLDAIAATDSLRAAASLAGVHHSTLQAHASEWSGELGFDVRSPAGRVRLSLALKLYRLANFTTFG